MTAAALQADVLVVGGGMAGAVAALAARARGARVALVRRSAAATALSSGAVAAAPDLWAAPGEPLEGRLGVAAAARRLAEARPDHPYAAVGPGLEALGEALAFAAAELGAVLAPPPPRQVHLASPYGAVGSYALAQRSMMAGDLAGRRGPLAVAGFRGHLGFDAALVAGALAAHPALTALRPVAIELDLFRREDQAVARPHELARALEAPGAAEQLALELRRALPTGARLALLPPVLGLDPGARVTERIAAAAGLEVAETVSDVPSVPGLRLQAAIDSRLEAAGVELLHGELAPAAGPGAAVEVAGRSVEAPSWVLASGRFVGGGIVRRGVLREALLGIPVQASEAGAAGHHLAGRGAASLTTRERRAAQELLAAGVRVDAALRPLGIDGRPVHDRLHAAGAVIGGHEVAADGTGLGVAILTGWLAGRAAAGARRAGAGTGPGPGLH